MPYKKANNFLTKYFLINKITFTCTGKLNKTYFTKLVRPTRSKCPRLIRPVFSLTSTPSIDKTFKLFHGDADDSLGWKKKALRGKDTGLAGMFVELRDLWSKSIKQLVKSSCVTCQEDSSFESC